MSLRREEAELRRALELSTQQVASLAQHRSHPHSTTNSLSSTAGKLDLQDSPHRHVAFSMLLSPSPPPHVSDALGLPGSTLCADMGGLDPHLFHTPASNIGTFASHMTENTPVSDINTFPQTLETPLQARAPESRVAVVLPARRDLRGSSIDPLDFLGMEDRMSPPHQEPHVLVWSSGPSVTGPTTSMPSKSSSSAAEVHDTGRRSARVRDIHEKEVEQKRKKDEAAAERRRRRQEEKDRLAAEEAARQREDTEYGGEYVPERPDKKRKVEKKPAKKKVDKPSQAKMSQAKSSATKSSQAKSSAAKSSQSSSSVAKSSQAESGMSSSSKPSQSKPRDKSLERMPLAEQESSSVSKVLETSVELSSHDRSLDRPSEQRKSSSNHAATMIPPQLSPPDPQSSGPKSSDPTSSFPKSSAPQSSAPRPSSPAKASARAGSTSSAKASLQTSSPTKASIPESYPDEAHSKTSSKATDQATAPVSRGPLQPAKSTSSSASRTPGINWKTSRNDLATVLNKFPGAKRTGMSKRTRMPSLHTTIGPPARVLPPPPPKSRTKVVSEDEDSESEGKVKVGSRQWLMMED